MRGSNSSISIHLLNFDSPLERYEASSDIYWQGQTLGNLGNVSYLQEDLQDAEQYYDRARGIFHQLEIRPGEATTLMNLGNVYADHGDLRQALDYYRRSLAIKRELGDREGANLLLTNIANVLSDLNETEEADRLTIGASEFTG